MEIIAVIALISMAGLMVSPRWMSFVATWQLDTEATKLKAKIREVQQLAITKGKNYRISFDLYGGNGWGMYTVTTLNLMWETEIIERIFMENNVEVFMTSFMMPETNTIQFEPLGNLSDAGTITLRHATTGKIRNINVNMFGKVTIEL